MNAFHITTRRIGQLVVSNEGTSYIVESLNRDGSFWASDEDGGVVCLTEEKVLADCPEPPKESQIMNEERMNVAVHPIILLGRSEGLTVTPWDTEEDCPCCGLGLSDCFYVDEWGRAYCEECLEDEIQK